ncbi:MAG: thiamine pyrophosphate-binding protein [Dehalococcoidia bacterium]|nr:thiamine pyrophosphate-binding protein [Dehalococcoidia bacterium]
MYDAIVAARQERVNAIVKHGSVDAALSSAGYPRRHDLTLSEAVVLGLLRQDVRTYFAVFGHGSTVVAEVLRVYQEAGLVRVLNVRSEIEASHAAAALRWATGKKSAVITSIGPGALHAMAASLVPASDGLGVWYLFGDETTEDEGFNMQQIPKYEQGLFLRLCSTMGHAYTLHTPLAVSTALKRGQTVVDHPYRAGPFFLLLPMNTQDVVLRQFVLNELPQKVSITMGAAEGDYTAAAKRLMESKRVIVRVGGGARGAEKEINELLDLADAVAVVSPVASGVVPYSNPRNMAAGGSKGTLCGNYAMENADLLLAVGTRFVCQSDCSRTAYLRVKQVININAEIEAAVNYNSDEQCGGSIALVGDIGLTLQRLLKELRKVPPKIQGKPSEWMSSCSARRAEWNKFKQERYERPLLYDDVWKKDVLTQPAVIKTADDWARSKEDVIKFFDAGDVQANAFQIIEDEAPGQTLNDTGASYMGFAVSALLATAASDKKFFGLAFSGDGSFTMNPQILIDGVQHGARGCILLLDNRRMAAITGLQMAQYGHEFATGDSVEVDYVKWAASIKGVLALDGGSSPDGLRAALDRAYAYDGLSLIHVPVYFGDNELGGMGVYGRWNVGNWCESTQALRHDIGL